MAKEKEIDLYNSEDSEFYDVDKSEDTIKDVLDERDYIPPLKEIGEDSLNSSEMDISLEIKEQEEEEIDMPSAEKDDQKENPQADQEAEVVLQESDEQIPEQSSGTDAADDPPDDVENPVKDDPETNGSDAEEELPPSEDESDSDEAADETDADEEIPETDALPDSDEPDIKNMSEEKLPAEAAPESSDNDFVGLDDDDLDEKPSPESELNSTEKPDKKEIASVPDKATAQKTKNGKSPKKKNPLKEVVKKTEKEPGLLQSTRRLSLVNKITSFALILLILAGGILYFNPGLIGLTKAEHALTPGPVDGIQPVVAVPHQAAIPSSTSKRGRCMEKIADAVQLRNELLVKKDEIYELNLHYHNGIADLENDIYQEINKESINSYEEAMKNTRISLNMRTIQRRLAYIKELTKPAYWLNSGSEELFYLVRKAELDLQLIDIAGGIDINKHMRHINAAMQKYRPSPDKLAVDPLLAKPQPLEQIWEQISAKKDKQVELSQTPKDEIIINQICAGNFSRIAELTSASRRAAKCLARMQGSDLFLNSLTTLAPDAAKQLFQWQGNWICLNGISQLSEEAAQHLFKWQGNWISLNSLNQFPPELAKHLLKWEGQQLELMGLEYNKNEASMKTMKYLALWETTGGKLFVSDKIRQEMTKLM